VIALVLFLLAGLSFGQEFTNIKVEKLTEDAGFAEGPAWSIDGYLLFSDTVANKIRKFVPGKGIVDYADREGGPIGNSYDAEGRLYSCEFRARRVTRTAKNGKVDVIAARFNGKRFNAPNDIVVRRDGHAYFTDPAFGNQEDTRELDFYGVFHLSPKGDVDLVAKWKTRPNGITLSPNGRTLYVSDSDDHLVRAYDVEKSGAASNERVVVRNIPGIPDGIRTDEKGNLYVAAKSIFVYATPSGAGDGKLLGRIDFSETPSNLTFGDPDEESLYVTARNSVYRVRIGSKGALQY